MQELETKGSLLATNNKESDADVVHSDRQLGCSKKDYICFKIMTEKEQKSKS